MKSIPRYAAVIFLVLAVLCYVAAWPSGAVILFVIGMLFEGAFWMTLFARRDKAPRQQPE